MELEYLISMIIFAGIAAMYLVDKYETKRKEFKKLDLNGEAKVIWSECDGEATLIGLQYEPMGNDGVRDLPRFMRQ